MHAKLMTPKCRGQENLKALLSIVVIEIHASQKLKNLMIENLSTFSEQWNF
jgi:hypothetical protein